MTVKLIHFVSTFFIVQFCFHTASCGKCTSVLNRKEIHEVTNKEPCVQRYEARCGWLSLNYCTFYRQTLCDVKKNVTVTIYYHYTACCDGFYKAKNGSCIKKQPGVIYEAQPSPFPTQISVDPNFVEEVPLPKKSLQEKAEITSGGYAGIACGLVLLLSITVFIVIAIRKKKRREKEKLQDPAHQVLFNCRQSGAGDQFVNKTGDQSINRSAIGARMQTTGANSREATPCSSRMVTPPTSPVKPETTVFVTQETADNLPETDI